MQIPPSSANNKSITAIAVAAIPAMDVRFVRYSRRFSSLSNFSMRWMYPQ